MQIKTTGNKEQRTNEMQTAPSHPQSRGGGTVDFLLSAPVTWVHPHTNTYYTNVYTLSFTLAAQRRELTEMVLTREDGTEVMGGHLQYVQ